MLSVTAGDDFVLDRKYIESRQRDGANDHGVVVLKPQSSRSSVSYPNAMPGFPIHGMYCEVKCVLNSVLYTSN